MASNTTPEEDRVLSAASEVGNVVAGLLSIIARFDADITLLKDRIEEANSRLRDAGWDEV